MSQQGTARIVLTVPVEVKEALTALAGGPQNLTPFILLEVLKALEIDEMAEQLAALDASHPAAGWMDRHPQPGVPIDIPRARVIQDSMGGMSDEEQMLAFLNWLTSDEQNQFRIPDEDVRGYTHYDLEEPSDFLTMRFATAHPQFQILDAELEDGGSYTIQEAGSYDDDDYDIDPADFEDELDDERPY